MQIEKFKYPGNSPEGLESLKRLPYFDSLPGDDPERKMVSQVNLTLMGRRDFPICVDLVIRLVYKRFRNRGNWEASSIADEYGKSVFTTSTENTMISSSDCILTRELYFYVFAPIPNSDIAHCVEETKVVEGAIKMLRSYTTNYENLEANFKEVQELRGRIVSAMNLNPQESFKLPGPTLKDQVNDYLATTNFQPDNYGEIHGLLVILFYVSYALVERNKFNQYFGSVKVRDNIFCNYTHCLLLSD